MQDEEKTVDIDTSGPDVDVQLPQEEPKEETNETNLKDGGIAVDTPKEPVEQSDVRVEENKTEQKTSEDVQGTTKDESDQRQDNRKEVEEYSESVKKRIAKLTKKCEKQKGKEKKLCVMLTASKKKEMRLRLKLILWTKTILQKWRIESLDN